MNLLEDIENKFGFKYPELYKLLYQENFLNWGAPCSNWYQDVYPKVKDNPPFLLYAKDFEILDFDRIVEKIEGITNPEDYRKTNPIYKFIPFAMNGAGDLYCFLYTEAFKNDVPVVFVWHDAKDADVKSKSLQDFIFRELLETVVDVWKESLVMNGDFKENTANLLKTHKKYLSENRQKIIEEIYGRELFTYHYEIDLQREEQATGLLTYNELDKLLKSELGFGQLDETFDYTLPEPAKEITEDNKRRVGTLTIKISPIPQRQDKIYDLLKVLNWRQQKNDESDVIEFYRKGSVIFGLPSMATVDDTFKDKLVELKTNFTNTELLYQENETGTIYKL